jgi:glycosyltransferase involved in cell wall biosynthesis
MHLSFVFLFGFVAFFWIFHGLRVAWGLVRLPWLKDFAPANDDNCPRISLLFAARDEEEKLPAALATLATIDYPRLEMIGVDDRSQDGTGRILDQFALTGPETGRYESSDPRGNRRFRVVHVTELPGGWLGKPHALQKAYEASSGEWLLFTDADVQFKPDAVRRAVALAQERKLDHLTLFGDVEMVGFWETVVVTFFGLTMHLVTDSYRVSDPNSRAYVGIGAFQLIKRSAYEACGTHRRLAMEVVDDMKLAKLVKQERLRSCVGVAQDFVAVRWHSGVSNLIRGVEKNFFAGLGYSVPLVIVAITASLLANVAPFAGVIFGHGWVRVLAGVSAATALCFHVGMDRVMRVSPLYAFTHPLGAMIFCWMLVRSTVVTLWRGGVTWRGTFYPLEELRRGST